MAHPCIYDMLLTEIDKVCYMQSVLLIASGAVNSLGAMVDLSRAEQEVGEAWRLYRTSTIKRFRDGLELGRICREWQANFKAQGSHKGEGFEHLLERVGIPKSTAYRWIIRYEEKVAPRPTWNEVHDPVDRSAQTRSHFTATTKPVSFTLILGSPETQDFQNNMALLGGYARVKELFLQFVSESAAKRAGDKHCASPPDCAMPRGHPGVQVSSVFAAEQR
jgi:hypothetical protein